MCLQSENGELDHIGHKLTQEGIKLDDEKVRAINDMQAPTRKKGVERLLGTLESSFPTWQPSLNLLECSCEMTLHFNNDMNKTKK